MRLKLERALHVQVLVPLHLVDELPHARVVALFRRRGGERGVSRRLAGAGETMAAASAVGVGATLLLALTMLALRGMPG